QFAAPDGYLVGITDYDVAGKQIHLVTGFAPLPQLPDLSRAVAQHLSGVGQERKVVVDLLTWREGDTPDIEALAGEVQGLLAGCRFDRPLWRLDVTVTSTAGEVPEHLRTQHLTYRHSETGFVEEPLYRNLHPMLAKRLDLWRLGNFALDRLPSAEDVYLFHGVAHDNPADHRLFALAEVRDLIPVADAAGRVSYPRLELMGLLALAAMRQALAGFPERDRPAAN